MIYTSLTKKHALVLILALSLIGGPPKLLLLRVRVGPAPNKPRNLVTGVGRDVALHIAVSRYHPEVDRHAGEAGGVRDGVVLELRSERT